MKTAIQSLLMFCSFSTFTASPSCPSDVPVLPALNLRSVENNISTGQIYIKDAVLEERWYSTVEEGVTYRMSVGTIDGVPGLSQCGTLNPIYLREPLPLLVEGNEVSLEACYATWDNNCAARLHVKARLCDGHTQYYIPSPEGTSGYCFEPDGDKATRPAPVPQPTVEPGLIYKRASSESEFWLPHLQFACKLNQTQSWMYYVQWFARVGEYDKLVKTFELTSDLNSTHLMEDHLLANNISLGTTISCVVSVALNRVSAKSKAAYSKAFFIGIKVLTPTINVQRGLTETLSLKQTVPLGCVYSENRTPEACHIKLALFNVDQILQCSDAAVAVKDATYCGAYLQGHTYNQCQGGCTGFQDRTIELKVLTKQEANYRVKHTFEILLSTEDHGVDHRIWKNYRVASARVTVADDSKIWQGSSCLSTADPQFTTFDGKGYYTKGTDELGVFTLYQNTAYPVEVQYQTAICTDSTIGTCTCGVAVRAGGDLWMYNTCNSASYIGFLSCADDILQVKGQGQTTYMYTLHTPIGTRIKVSMQATEKYLNIIINPSPSDVGKTRGHCGTLNGNMWDELKNYDGSILNDTRSTSPAIDKFFRTWRVSDDKSYFKQRNNNPQSWSTDQLSCVCAKSSGFVSEVMCSADQTAACQNRVNNPVCNNRRKRSTYRHTRDMEKMFHLTNTLPTFVPERRTRSAEDDNVTFREAYDKCLEFFKARPLYQLKDSVPQSRLNLSLVACANDATIDITMTSWMSSHFESWAMKIDSEIVRNATYREAQPADLKRFKETRCMDDCNGNGQCVKGVCMCDAGYAGSTCFIQKAAPLTLTHIEGGGKCDVNFDTECHDCLQVKTEYFLEDFYCNITVHQVGIDGQTDQIEQFTNPGEYENLFEGHCCPQREPMSQEPAFVTKYLVAVSNDGTNFGPPRPVYVYDSACQDYTLLGNGDLLFSLKPNTCFIEGRCLQKGETSTVTSDNVCLPEKDITMSSTGGYDISDNEEPDDNKLVVIIPVVIACLVVIGLATVFVIWKCKRHGLLIISGSPSMSHHQKLYGRTTTYDNTDKHVYVNDVWYRHSST